MAAKSLEARLEALETAILPAPDREIDIEAARRLLSGRPVCIDYPEVPRQKMSRLEYARADVAAAKRFLESSRD